MNYDVRATPWRHGWELHIDGVGVTQARSLKSAESMVRDYVESLTGHPVTGTVSIVPDLGGLERKAQEARAHTEQAQREARLAATESRQIARQLRKSGLSIGDTGLVMGISKARAAQLLK
jgi:hypothetical protein